MKLLPDTLTKNPPPLKQVLQGNASPLALLGWVNKQEWLWNALAVSAFAAQVLLFAMNHAVSDDIIKTLKPVRPKYYTAMDTTSKTAILSTLGAYGIRKREEKTISWIYLSSPPPDDYRDFIAKTAKTYIASINANTTLQQRAKNWDVATPRERLATLQTCADLYTQKMDLPPIQIAAGQLKPDRISIYRKSPLKHQIIFNINLQNEDPSSLITGTFEGCVSALGHELMHYTQHTQSVHPEKTAFSPATQEWLKLVNAEWPVPQTEDMQRPPSEVTAYGFETEILKARKSAPIFSPISRP